MENGQILALAIGLTGSAVIHLSQGLLRWSFQMRERKAAHRYSGPLYVIGLALNFTAPLWVVAANRFGPTILYTSMYASGLFWLILFSRWKLGRRIQRREVFGVGLLIAGSILLVFGFYRTDIAGMETARPAWLVGTALAMAILVWPAAALAERCRRLPAGLVLGAFGGGFLALDSLLKGVAQSDGGTPGYLPSTGGGWVLFLLSFLGAAAALGMTQWAHAKKQPPTATIAAYDASYVVLPILILPMAHGRLPGIDALCLPGILVVMFGLYQIGKANASEVGITRTSVG